MASEDLQKNISPEEFIKAWQEAKNAKAFLAKFDLPESKWPVILARANEYRRMGVRLKKFTGGKARLDVEALNRLIESLAEQGIGEVGPVRMESPVRSAPVEGDTVEETMRNLLAKIHAGQSA